MLLYTIPLLGSKIRNMVLIAHPDDETMFFTPLLQNLTGDTHIICLSNGNYENKGQIRTNEIQKVCNSYNFKLILLDVFEDNKDWSISNIKAILEFYNLIYNYDVIYTFDSCGVSGHKNHISCHLAVKEMIPYIKAKVYFLESKNLFRKYVYDYGTKNGVLYSATSYKQGVSMMMTYKSQLTWYRYLFMLFSTYFRHVYLTDE